MNAVTREIPGPVRVVRSYDDVARVWCYSAWRPVAEGERFAATEDDERGKPWGRVDALRPSVEGLPTEPGARLGALLEYEIQQRELAYRRIAEAFPEASEGFRTFGQVIGLGDPKQVLSRLRRKSKIPPESTHNHAPTFAGLGMLALLLGGCLEGSITLDVDDVAFASQERYLFNPDPDREQAIKDAWDELEALGIRVRYWDNPNATAFEDTLYLSNRFPDRPVKEKAEILTHELVHYHQRGSLQDFDGRYALILEFRWAVELQGGRQEIRTDWIHGEPCRNLELDAIGVVEDLADGYGLGAVENLWEVSIPIVWLEVEAAGCGPPPML